MYWPSPSPWPRAPGSASVSTLNLKLGFLQRLVKQSLPLSPLRTDPRVSLISFRALPGPTPQASQETLERTPATTMAMAKTAKPVAFATRMSAVS